MKKFNQQLKKILDYNIFKRKRKVKLSLTKSMMLVKSLGQNAMLIWNLIDYNCD